MSAAKAVAALLAAWLVGWATERLGLVLDVNVVQELIVAIITAAIVYLVPNRPQPARPPA